MKRGELIERLLVLEETKERKERFGRQLDNMSNENIRAVYERLRPKLEARQEQIDRVRRRERRRRQWAERQQQQAEWGRAWSRRWKHPKVAYPIEGRYEPITVFELGVALLNAVR